MKILKLFGAEFFSYNAAELAAWVASNPLDGDVVHDADNLMLVQFNEATQTADPILQAGGGGGSYVETFSINVKQYTGANYVNAVLIDAQILLFLIDGVPRYASDGHLFIPGLDYEFDPATGTLDINEPFDLNNLIIQFKKTITAP